MTSRTDDFSCVGCGKYLFSKYRPSLEELKRDYYCAQCGAGPSEAAQPTVQAGAASDNLFELWWADYMPEATRDHAWKAYSAALPPEGADDEATPAPQEAQPAPQQGESVTPAYAPLTGRTHELKTDGPVFHELRAGRKLFEIRKDDRGYQCGDLLRLRATLYPGAEIAAGHPLVYTGEEEIRRVIGILRGPAYGLADGWVIMSVAAVGATHPAQPAEQAGDAVQWWLAELDQYGNPRLTDGAHGDRAGADKAKYLIDAMHLAKPGTRHAVARVELSEPRPSPGGVDHEAVGLVNAARAAQAQGGKT